MCVGISSVVGGGSGVCFILSTSIYYTAILLYLTRDLLTVRETFSLPHKYIGFWCQMGGMEMQQGMAGGYPMGAAGMVHGMGVSLNKYITVV